MRVCLCMFVAICIDNQKIVDAVCSCTHWSFKGSPARLPFYLYFLFVFRNFSDEILADGICVINSLLKSRVFVLPFF